MIITCPNCETRYEVAEKAIGAAGRKVQCASCHQSWQAMPEQKPRPAPKRVETAAVPKEEPEDDTLFDEDAEAELDAAFSEEEEKLAPKKPDEAAIADTEEESEAPEEKAEIDPALKRSRQKAMLKRQMKFARSLPLNRIRTNLRLAAVVALGLFVGGGFYLRTEIVRILPDLAGVYESIGLGVNVIGLEFRDVETLRSLQDGADVMSISARLYNVSGRQVRVPPVVVTILNIEGQPLYSWSVTPFVRSAGPGEIVELETQLNSPPAGAETVRLAFADERGG